MQLELWVSSLLLHTLIIVLLFSKSSVTCFFLFWATSRLEIRAYTDVVWADDPITRKFITGFCIFLGDSQKAGKNFTLEAKYHVIFYYKGDRTPQTTYRRHGYTYPVTDSSLLWQQERHSDSKQSSVPRTYQTYRDRCSLCSPIITSQNRVATLLLDHCSDCRLPQSSSDSEVSVSCGQTHVLFHLEFVGTYWCT